MLLEINKEKYFNDKELKKRKIKLKNWQEKIEKNFRNIDQKGEKYFVEKKKVRSKLEKEMSQKMQYKG